MMLRICIITRFMKRNCASVSPSCAINFDRFSASLSKAKCLFALCSLFLAGCSTTKYRSVTREPGGIVVERELSASSVFVKRDVGKVVLGADSLDGSKSDQMQAASDALALASAALKR